MMIYDVSSSAIAEAAKIYRMELDDARFRLSAEGDLFSGMKCLSYGLISMSREFLRSALSMALQDTRRGEPGVKDTAFIPESREETLADIPGKYRDRVTIVGEIKAPGQGAMSKSLQWKRLALCRWLLDSQHDAASLKAASDELAKCYALQPKDEQYDSMAMDDQGMTYVAAGDDQRFLDLCSNARKFKPPAKPGMVRSPRSMAYVLAAHRLKQFWSANEVERAWSTFLKTYVPKAMSGGAITDLALWLKMRYWDRGESAPTLSPVEAFLRLYDYLPGVERPPLQV